MITVLGKITKFRLSNIYLVLIIIVALAFFLRVINIQNNPKSMYGDSLTLVYDAYSILKTGHDQKGEYLPLVFSLGGSRPPLYVYATLPFVALFGPSEIAARSVSVLSGIGIIILMFFIGKVLLDSKLGLIASALVALSSWDLSLSRGAFETHFALFLALFGVYAFFKAERNKIWYLVSAIFFALPAQTYSTYRLIIPLFAVFLFVIYKKNLLNFFRKQKVLALSCLWVLVFSTFLSIWLMVGNQKGDRFSEINVFTREDINSQLVQQINNDRKLDQLPKPASAIFNNKYIGYVGLIAENYVRNFFPSFLILHGDRNPRHNPGEKGELYWIDVLLIVFGIIFLYKNNRKILKLIVGWILISPIATALVGEPHALRDSFLLPPLLLLASYGLWVIWNQRKLKFRKTFLVGLGLLFLLQFGFFIDRFYFISSNKNASFWSYSAREATEIALKNKDQFDYIILSTNIPDMEFAYPVYTKLDPNTVIYQNKNVQKEKEYFKGYRILNYDNVYIGEIPRGNLRSFLQTIPGSLIYIGSIEDRNYIDNYNINYNADDVPDLVIYTRTR